MGARHCAIHSRFSTVRTRDIHVRGSGVEWAPGVVRRWPSRSARRLAVTPLGCRVCASVRHAS
eukprot:11019708-Lingulodinium_polyedra.AAC.1